MPDTMVVLLAVALAVVGAGCAGGGAPGSPALPEGGTLRFDAAMLAQLDAGPDAPRDASIRADAGPIGPDAGGTDAGRPCSATASADGVLTNHPELSFTNLGGPLVLRTAYLEVIEGTSLTTLVVFGEVENTGTQIECTPLPDFYVGFLNLYPVVSGPSYNISTSTVSSVCLAPGARGVVFGIENDVSPYILDSMPRIQYAMDSRPETFSTPDPSSRPIIVTSDARTGTTGTVIFGTARVSRPIRNVELEFYGRNACGLVWGQWSSFPEDFETSVIGTFDFETFGESTRRPGVPVDWLGYSQFIDDARRTSTLAASTDRGARAWARREEVRRRLAELRAR